MNWGQSVQNMSSVLVKLLQNSSAVVTAVHDKVLTFGTTALLVLCPVGFLLGLKGVLKPKPKRELKCM